MSLQSNYLKLNDKDQIDFLTEQHITKKLSLRQIAKNAGVSVNTIKRHCTKLGIKVRNHAEAQAVAIAEGRHPHPTKNKGHNQETKTKISDGMYDAWQNDIDKAHRSEVSKRVWEALDPEKKKEIKEKGFAAVRQTSVHGSKMERFLLENLPKFGFRTSFHHEKSLGGTRLQIDLMVEELGVAIEVNGPSHKDNFWGDKSFSRTQRADYKKKALILDYGLCLIYVNTTGSVSAKRQQLLLAELVKTLEGIKANYPPKEHRFFEIGV
jgi:DNA-binding CsgD family transcriptional regulator